MNFSKSMIARDITWPLFLNSQLKEGCPQHVQAHWLAYQYSQLNYSCCKSSVILRFLHNYSLNDRHGSINFPMTWNIWWWRGARKKCSEPDPRSNEGHIHDDSNDHMLHIDFAKTIDSVCHIGLLENIDLIGVCEKFFEESGGKWGDELTGCQFPLRYPSGQVQMWGT